MTTVILVNPTDTATAAPGPQISQPATDGDEPVTSKSFIYAVVATISVGIVLTVGLILYRRARRKKTLIIHEERPQPQQSRDAPVTINLMQSSFQEQPYHEEEEEEYEEEEEEEEDYPRRKQTNSKTTSHGETPPSYDRVLNAKASKDFDSGSDSDGRTRSPERRGRKRRRTQNRNSRRRTPIKRNQRKSSALDMSYSIPMPPQAAYQPYYSAPPPMPYYPPPMTYYQPPQAPPTYPSTSIYRFF